MRIWPLCAIGALPLTLGLTMLACGNTCRSTSDCDESQHCDIELQECIDGCKSNADCADSAYCRVDVGRCEPKERPLPFDAGLPDGTSTSSDAGALDSGTSTTADAGAFDGG